MKCDGCIYRGMYQDMGATIPLCTLHKDLITAIRAFACSQECNYKKTIDDVRKELGINDKK